MNVEDKVRFLLDYLRILNLLMRDNHQVNAVVVRVINELDKLLVYN